jgi:hypothetical protein
MFGGGFTNELWQLSLAGSTAWSQLVPSGTPPSPRSRHIALYDPVRDRMIVFGGSDDTQTWALDFAPTLQWHSLATSGMPPSSGDQRVGIYDPLGDRLVVFAGTSSVDAWALDLSITPSPWAQLTPTGTPPPAFQDYSAIYDSRNDRAVLFGAAPGNRTWALNWERPVTGVPVVSAVNVGFRFEGARPSPGRTLTLSFTIPTNDPVRLDLFDLRGRAVLTQTIPGVGPGAHLIRISDADRLPPGNYLMRLSQGGSSRSKKVVLLP